jgi:acyl-CoA synthetase (AMP-forming)/AMP-acid ligase II
MGLTSLVARSGQSPKYWKIHAPAFPSNGQSKSSGSLLIQVTSATMGRPKVVPLSAANFDAGIEPRRVLLQLSFSDRLLQMTSMSHSMGIENTFAQFLAGGAVIATNGFDSTTFRRWLIDLRPTWYDCSPTIHQAALAQLKREPLDSLVSLRFIQSAGAPLADDIRQGSSRSSAFPCGMTTA